MTRPTVGIVTGVVTDAASGKAINGATIRIGDKSYTTDSFESLFSAYSSPEELEMVFSTLKISQMVFNKLPMNRRLLF